MYDNVMVAGNLKACKSCTHVHVQIFLALFILFSVDVFVSCFHIKEIFCPWIKEVHIQHMAWQQLYSSCCTLQIWMNGHWLSTWSFLKITLYAIINWIYLLDLWHRKKKKHFDTDSGLYQTYCSQRKNMHNLQPELLPNSNCLLESMLSFWKIHQFLWLNTL